MSTSSTKLHVNAFFHVNRFYKGEEIRYEVTPLLNYDRTFLFETTPMMILQFKKELKVIEEHKNLFEQEIEELQSQNKLDKKKIKSMVENYNQNLWRALSKLDNYQFTDWTPYNHYEAIGRKVGVRRN